MLWPHHTCAHANRYSVATYCASKAPPLVSNEGDEIVSEFRREPVLKLLLNRENPRHTPKENQAEIIEHLVDGEEVYNLARHLSQNGFNPLEVTAVFRDDDGNLVVAEGNRRICAAQLVNDPNKAPPTARAKFRTLAADAQADVTKVMVREFPDYETARPWLQVLHDGEQDGVGRRQWSPTQKSRATMRRSTDALAVALLDHAEAARWLAQQDRADILVSTVTRYLANPDVRAALGLASAATSPQIEVYGDRNRFEAAAQRFIRDIQSGTLSSRSTSSDWRSYARMLNEEHGKVELGGPSWRPSDPGGKPSTGKAKPASHRSAKARLAPPDTSKIVLSKDLVDALNALGSHKLTSLYRSLTTLRLDEHPALLTIGTWVFFETLTAKHGRPDGTKFVAYLNNKAASAYGRLPWKSKRIALEYIEDHGNVEKHDPSFSLIDASNLYNHFLTLDDLLVKLVSECPR